jgi:hypothetical protein
VKENRTPPPTPPETPYRRKAIWAKPMPKSRPNFIPRQSYLEYNWGAEERDPDLEFALFAIQESGWTLEQIELETEKHGRKVSRYCLLGWHFKGVRRPQNATLSIVMSVLGWERPWVQRS